MIRFMRRMHVAVLAYEGCLGAEAFGFADMLLIANRVARNEPAPFAVSIVAAQPASIRLAGGIAIEASRLAPGVDLLVVPGFDFKHAMQLDTHLQARREEVDLVRRVFARGMPIASICVGAFLLGEAGLLDGRKVTTAWSFAPELAARYPKARVQQSAMLIEDRGLTTTGAFSAAAELAMRIIRRACGAQVADAAAKLTLSSDRRDSQLAYMDSNLLQRMGGSFSTDVKRWLARRIGLRYNLAEVARSFHVSERTLLRRFKHETGMTPLEFLQEARVQNAKALLESARLSLADVAARCGYADMVSFRRVFARTTGLPPGAYRRRFRNRER